MTTRLATANHARAASSAASEPTPATLDALAAGAAAIAGMTPAMLDRRALRHTLKQRMAALRLAQEELYLALYNSDAAERAAFLEGVLIGETSFFRDATVFAELSRWCLGWFSHHKRTMRILSAPCSTGEEPYSIAITLHLAGVPLERFTIDALDISPNAIEQAKAAAYKGFSLRNVPQPEQASFLERDGDSWRVIQPLREQVSLRQANLMDPDALGRESYDLICSRNLLIYQSPASRRTIAEALAAALKPGGRLILGAADWGRDLDESFLLEEPIHSFALRLRDTHEHAAPDRRQHALPVPTERRSVLRSVLRTVLRTAPRTVKAPAPRPDGASLQLADVSDLYRKALQAYLRGDERESERLCRQTLYLEEDHMPSLELLNKIHRPHASPRMKLALKARLKRHRDAVANDTFAEKAQ